MSHIAIGPNAYLSHNELFVDGQRTAIGDSQAFKMFAINTAAVVASVLARAIPTPCKSPNLEGGFGEEIVEPWVRYSDLALQLRHSPSHDTIVSIGREMLAWCALACAVADIANTDDRDDDDFLIARYLAANGGGLRRTPEEWALYLKERAAYRALPLERRIELSEPQPTPGLSVRLAWPELLGIPLGGQDRLIENVLAVAVDIHMTEAHTRVIGPMRQYQLLLPQATGLNHACQQACELESTAIQSIQAGDSKYTLRVHRTSLPSGVMHTARVVSVTAASAGNSTPQ